MSSVVQEAIDYYMRERKKKKLAQKALALVGKTKISTDILTDLEFLPLIHLFLPDLLPIKTVLFS